MEKITVPKTKKIVLSALMLAIFIILDRFVSINIQILAINFSAIAIMLVAIYCGPKYSTLVALLGDLIAALLFPFGSYFVGFTITNAIMGLIFGLFLYDQPNKKRKKPIKEVKLKFIIKAIIVNVLVLIFVNMIFNTFCIHLMYGKAFWALIISRGVAQIVMCIINTALIIILEKVLRPFAKKYLYEKEENKMNIDEYLETFDKFTKDPNLDAMKYIMKEFDEPNKKCKFIHVAGTNGKGSVCEMLSYILAETGYKVGKFISPHLLNFNDEIYINNKEISNEEVEEILIPLSEKIEKYNKEHKVPVKWFEAITCLALIYFAKNNCDFVVLETGLGGTTDCTNVVDSIVSIITNIGYDHVDILGDSLKKITQHKAGIIKENSDTVIVEQSKEINEIIEQKCKENNTNLHKINKEEINNYSYDNYLQKFDFMNYKNIEINLKGKAQIYNATQVLTTINILKEKGYKISEDAIKIGLKKVIHRARLEILKENPLIVFDGAHNENAIENFKQNIERYYNDYKKIYIISILKTKDYKTVVQKLCEDKEAIFIFTDGNDKKKYVAKEKLYNIAYDCINFSKIFKMEFTKAINVATKIYNNRLILIVGSFYVYKDVVKFLEKKEKE